jgi:hypothetical protein
MHKNATKCNKTLSKWCKNKHGASKIIDTFETYHAPCLESPQAWTLPGRTSSIGTDRGNGGRWIYGLTGSFIKITAVQIASSYSSSSPTSTAIDTKINLRGRRASIRGHSSIKCGCATRFFMLPQVNNLYMRSSSALDRSRATTPDKFPSQILFSSLMDKSTNQLFYLDLIPRMHTWLFVH